MAIQFVIEDGTGLSTATSYVSEAEFVQYWENKGVDYTAEPTATIQAWLNNSSAWADNTHTWDGLLLTEDQALAAPRAHWYDVYGRDISSSVPTFLKNGVCEIAAAMKVQKASTVSSGVKSRTVGPLSVTFGASNNPSNQNPYYNQAEKWFGKLAQRRGIDIFPT